MDGSPLQGMRAYIMTQTSAFAPTSNYREHRPLRFAEHNELLTSVRLPLTLEELLSHLPNASRWLLSKSALKSKVFYR